MKFKMLLASLLCGLVAAAPAQAQLAIDRLWLDLEAGAAPRTDVIIRNESQDRYYISVQASEIINPGTEQEERRTVANPEELGLLVTPNRLVMEPEAMRSIRVVSLTQPENDRIYRLLISPQVGAVEVPLGEEPRAAALKILAAYDVLVSIRPDKASANIVAERVGSELVLRNQGNTNAVLFDGQACSARQADDCAPIEARRLYAGNEWRIPLRSADDTVQFRMQRFASQEPSTVTF